MYLQGQRNPPLKNNKHYGDYLSHFTPTPEKKREKPRKFEQQDAKTYGYIVWWFCWMHTWVDKRTGLLSISMPYFIFLSSSISRKAVTVALIINNNRQKKLVAFVSILNTIESNDLNECYVLIDLMGYILEK